MRTNSGKGHITLALLPFFIMSLLAWLALFVLLFVLLIDSRLFGVPTSGLLSSVFTIYSLIASFVVIRGMIKLKSGIIKNLKNRIYAGNTAGKFWNWLYYFSIAVFCYLFYILLYLLLPSLLYGLNNPSILFYLFFYFFFVLLIPGFAVFYGLFGSGDSNKLRKRVYYGSVAAFFITYFTIPVLYGLNLDKIIPNGAISFLDPLPRSLLPMGYILAFAIFYGIVRVTDFIKNVKNEIRNTSGKLWKWAYYVSVVLFFISSCILLIEKIHLQRTVFVLDVFVVLSISGFIVLYGLVRRKHSNKFWKYAYNFNVATFFIIFFVVPSLHWRITEFLNAAYLLSTLFAVFYSTLRLKKDPS